jgi:AcrR family transcriptional regulator
MSTDIVKRRYDSPLRRAQAEETRNRILDAALGRFADHGYAATSIASIARDAGVVPETVYATFRSKHGIVDGLTERAAPAGLVAGLHEAWAARSGDPAAQLEYLAGFAADFWNRNDDLAAVFRMGTGDAEIGDLWATRQAERRVMFAGFTAAWPRSALRRGVTRDEATDLIWALASDELFHLLVRERGWTVQRYRAWLAGELRSAVLATPG